MYCGNCGFKLDDDAKFCKNCGIQILETDVQNLETNNTTTATYGQVNPNTKKQLNTGTKKKGSLVPLLIAGIVVIALLGFLGSKLLGRGGSSSIGTAAISCDYTYSDEEYKTTENIKFYGSDKNINRITDSSEQVLINAKVDQDELQYYEDYMAELLKDFENYDGISFDYKVATQGDDLAVTINYDIDATRLSRDDLDDVLMMMDFYFSNYLDELTISEIKTDLEQNYEFKCN